MNAVGRVTWCGWLVGIAMIGAVYARPSGPGTIAPFPEPTRSSPTAAPSGDASPSPAASASAGAAPSSPAPIATPSAAATPAPADTGPTVHAIWDYQKELGLTSAQITKIKTTIRDLQTKAEQAQGHFLFASKELKDLLGHEDSDIEKIRSKMHELATLQINMQIENLKAQRSLHHIMSAAQLAKWRDIQRAQQQP